MTGKHRAGRPKTETSDYVAMLTRMINAWGDRVADDPAALVHLGGLIEALRDATNRGMFEGNRRPGGYSLADMASILGVSRTAVWKRIQLGEAAYAAFHGVRPAVRLADIRRARAAGLASAGVTDITGSERERRAV